MPLDIRDPKSGMDYFTAANMLTNGWGNLPAQPPSAPSLQPTRRSGKNVFPGAIGPLLDHGGFGPLTRYGSFHCPSGHVSASANVTVTQAMYGLYSLLPAQRNCCPSSTPTCPEKPQKISLALPPDRRMLPLLRHPRRTSHSLRLLQSSIHLALRLAQHRNQLLSRTAGDDTARHDPRPAVGLQLHLFQVDGHWFQRRAHQPVRRLSTRPIRSSTPGRPPSFAPCPISTPLTSSIPTGCTNCPSVAAKGSPQPPAVC